MMIYMPKRSQQVHVFEHTYNQLKGKRVKSPILGAEVYITRLGWEHIVSSYPYRPNKKRRPFAEILRRLGLLDAIVPILSSKNALHRKRISGEFEYHVFVEKFKGVPVCVVVSKKRKEGARYTFYSLFVVNKKDPLLAPTQK